MNFDVLRGVVFGGMAVGVAWLLWETWKPRKKPPTQCYAQEQLDEWERELAEAECDLALARFQMVADDPDIDCDVKDALFLVEARVVPIFEEMR